MWEKIKEKLEDMYDWVEEFLEDNFNIELWGTTINISEKY